MNYMKNTAASVTAEDWGGTGVSATGGTKMVQSAMLFGGTSMDLEGYFHGGASCPGRGL